MTNLLYNPEITSESEIESIIKMYDESADPIHDFQTNWTNKKVQITERGILLISTPRLEKFVHVVSPQFIELMFRQTYNMHDETGKLSPEPGFCYLNGLESIVGIEFVDSVDLGKIIESNSMFQTSHYTHDSFNGLVSLSIAIADHLLLVHKGGESGQNKRILHKDYQPRNILLTGDGRLLVTDFGFSDYMGHKYSIYKELMRRGGAPSPFGFRAPELRKGADYGEITEAYAVGKVILSLLMGNLSLLRGSGFNLVEMDKKNRFRTRKCVDYIKQANGLRRGFFTGDELEVFKMLKGMLHPNQWKRKYVTDFIDGCRQYEGEIVLEEFIVDCVNRYRTNIPVIPN